MRPDLLAAVFLLVSCGGSKSETETDTLTDGDADADADADSDADTDTDTDTVAGDCVQLDHKGLYSLVLPFPMNGDSNWFLGAEDYAMSPGDRVYFLSDYNLQGRPWDLHWSFFLYVLDPDPQCSINIVDLDENQHLVDTRVWWPDGSEISLAPLWGAGPTQGADEGINVWDIDDIVLDDDECPGMTVHEVLDLAPSGENRFILWDYGGVGDAVVRHFDVYVGHPVVCP